MNASATGAERARRRSSITVPVAAGVLVAVGGGGSLPVALAVAATVVLVGAVLLAVGHAEAVAHRVGEPYGAVVLAVAVTVIEVGLIVTLMATEPGKTASLARDTVFAAIMISANGLVGVALMIACVRRGTVTFRADGARALLGTLVTLTTLGLVLPRFTTSSRGPTFTDSQMAFSAVAAIAVYGLFLFVQTTRHRTWFVPEVDETAPAPVVTGPDPSPAKRLGRDIALLLVTLVAVVALAKTLAPSIEDAVASAGAPESAVGVVIAIFVLLPEGLAASRAAQRDEVQTSLNLALGSGLASIGLTIPAVAVASIWLDGRVTLGLDAKEIVLFALTAVVGAITYSSGRATVLQAAHHLTVFAAFLFVAVVP
ncbi:MAG: calcium:proton antiporter [Acidimicrobiia bacterium]